MVTDRQFRRLRKLIQTEPTLANAADKAGVDEKTARKYRDSDRLPSQRRSPPHLADPGGPVPGRLARTRRAAPAQPRTPGQDPVRRPATPLSRPLPRRPAPLPCSGASSSGVPWKGRPRRCSSPRSTSPGGSPRATSPTGRTRRHHRRRAVRPPGLPLRADLLQLGDRHRSASPRASRASAKGCKTPCGNWEESPGGTAPIA